MKKPILRKYSLILIAVVVMTALLVLALPAITTAQTPTPAATPMMTPTPAASPSPNPSPSPAPSPEPVHYPLVQGWYRGNDVQYYDFGASTPLVRGQPWVAPIFALAYGMNEDGTPDLVPGQHNIVSLVPGDPGYSDLWQVYLVTVPESYEADSIKSISGLFNGEHTILQTDMFVNCPIVPAGSTLENGMSLTQGWYNDEPVYYFDFGANPKTAAPIYALITGMDDQGNPQFVEGQRNIIDVIPGDPGYTAFWQVNLVTVPSDYMANTLQSADDVLSSGYSMMVTDVLVNCPVHVPASPQASPAGSPTSSPSPSPSPGMTP